MSQWYFITAAAAAAKSLQSCLTLCDPQTAAHQAPPSLEFSTQEHWSGLPFPSPMHESEKCRYLILKICILLASFKVKDNTKYLEILHNHFHSFFKSCLYRLAKCYRSLISYFKHPKQNCFGLYDIFLSLVITVSTEYNFVFYSQIPLSFSLRIESHNPQLQYQIE